LSATSQCPSLLSQSSFVSIVITIPLTGYMSAYVEWFQWLQASIVEAWTLAALCYSSTKASIHRPTTKCPVIATADSPNTQGIWNLRPKTWLSADKYWIGLQQRIFNVFICICYSCHHLGSFGTIILHDAMLMLVLPDMDMGWVSPWAQLRWVGSHLNHKLTYKTRDQQV